MTTITTIFLTYQELYDLQLTDEKMKGMGFRLKAFDTHGRAYEKVERKSWTCNDENCPSDTFSRHG